MEYNANGIRPRLCGGERIRRPRNPTNFYASSLHLMYPNHYPMNRRSPKPPRNKPKTAELLAGSADDDDGGVERSIRFGARGKLAQRGKMERTAQLRLADGIISDDIQGLPVGQVKQIYSLFCLVSHPTGDRLCVLRKTMAKLAHTALVVGDEVRFRDPTPNDPIAIEAIPAELKPIVAAANLPSTPAVIEQIMPRRTILTRTNSFHQDQQHPIVANADQMLIVASLLRPQIKWSLIDRMIIAARSGGLEPIVCLNKIDLGDDIALAGPQMHHYASMQIRCCRTSVITRAGLAELGELLKNKTTVLAGHSGVGKSSLISAVEPSIDIRIGEVSAFTDKGIHTTTSARRYDLPHGGCVIDTPGVKLFGLWDVTRENLLEYFPDVEAETAPTWRKESHERIAHSLKSPSFKN